MAPRVTLPKGWREKNNLRNPVGGSARSGLATATSQEPRAQSRMAVTRSVVRVAVRTARLGRRLPLATPSGYAHDAWAGQGRAGVQSPLSTRLAV